MSMKPIAVLLTVLTFAVTGCGITDPSVDNKPTTAAPTNAVSAPTSLGASTLRLAGTKPMRSPRALVTRFGELAGNFGLSPRPQQLNTAVALGTRHQAAYTAGIFNSAMAQREKARQLPQAQVLGVDFQRGSPFSVALVIVREGNYSADGVPIGTPRVVVYNAHLTSRPGGYLISSWQGAR